MMSEYIVKHGQNIFDVALQLYGSIEGVFDLLISNPRLSMETQLEDGDVLCYHDYFVINSNIVASLDGDVVNGERSTYHQVSSLPLLMIIKPENDETTIDVSMSGEGSISIDWGDSSPMSNFTLHNEEQRIRDRKSVV